MMQKQHVRRGIVACSVVAAAVGTAVLAAPDTTGAAPAQTAHRAAISMPVRRELLIVGASYSAALGASSAPHGYARMVGADLGWPTRVAAVPGTGYLNPGRHGRNTLADQISRLPANLDPGLVVLQAGRNDAGYPLPRLRSAVCATVRQARAKFRSAEIVMLGNVPFTAAVSPAQRGVERTLSAAARSCHVSFIDPIAERWITPVNAASMVGRVTGHPNDAGYAYIARRLVSDLSRLTGKSLTQLRQSPVQVAPLLVPQPFVPASTSAPTNAL